MAHPPGQRPGGGTSQATGLLVVRVCVGLYMLFFGVDKVSWLLDSTPLATQLSSWLTDAQPVSRWYLERIMPGAPVFARLLPLGALLGGVALVLGFWTRLAAGFSLLLVLGLQLAAGSMFKLGYLADAGGLLLAGVLLGLTVGGGKLPLSVRK